MFPSENITLRNQNYVLMMFLSSLINATLIRVQRCEAKLQLFNAPFSADSPMPWSSELSAYAVMPFMKEFVFSNFQIKFM